MSRYAIRLYLDHLNIVSEQQVCLPYLCTCMRYPFGLSLGFFVVQQRQHMPLLCSDNNSNWFDVCMWYIMNASGYNSVLQGFFLKFALATEIWVIKEVAADLLTWG